jgi:pre-mRNA-splicing factor RBM22/SLT11
MRLKRTEICVTCAKLKNICQTCVLDLDLKVPLDVRDKALGMVDAMPKHNIAREMFTNKAEEEMKKNDGKLNNATLGLVGSVNRETLKRFAESDTFKKRQKVLVCPDFLKGECPRGKDCEFRYVYIYLSCR